MGFIFIVFMAIVSLIALVVVNITFIYTFIKHFHDEYRIKYGTFFAKQAFRKRLFLVWLYIPLCLVFIVVVVVSVNQFVLFNQLKKDMVASDRFVVHLGGGYDRKGDEGKILFETDKPKVIEYFSETIYLMTIDTSIVGMSCMCLGDFRFNSLANS
jgi:heme/copper-type cytochrome/quinol oxidase subunit 2